MDLRGLIESARKNSGTLGALASEIGRHQNRITEWKKGIAKPGASEIAAMASIAKLPILQTVAEVEGSNHPEFAKIWKRALTEALRKS